LPVLRILAPELAAFPIANASIGGSKEAYIKKDTGAILRPPSSFLVQTNTSGSGEVRAVACPMLISFIAKIFLSCNMQTAFRQIRIDFCRYIYYTKNKFRVKYAEISYTV